MKRGPRPPVTASKEKRTYTPGQYDYYKAEWERHRNAPDFGKGNEWLTETPALEVAAQPFLATLDELGKLTQQTIFHELRDGIKSGWLINKGGNWAATHVLNACNPRVWDLCEEILEDIGTKKGSKRVILAKVAAEKQVIASSFEAAHARLQLLFRAWKRMKAWQLKLDKACSNSNS
ncbi:hypothetical protein MA20_46880 [Bradyrhizobium japonicum]|uniref:Uncharacterized protein n=1 Tax=Bradyrhizobium japonicum TaxID=375 RepID=A0A0A3XIF6_BRAJP|nr:hypothetical protein MA20_46880 [Bradyrhizobium japonicum]